MSKKGYRLLLVFSVVMLLIAVAIDIAFPGLIPDVYYEARKTMKRPALMVPTPRS